MNTDEICYCDHSANEHDHRFYPGLSTCLVDGDTTTAPPQPGQRVRFRDGGDSGLLLKVEPNGRRASVLWDSTNNVGFADLSFLLRSSACRVNDCDCESYKHNSNKDVE